MIKLILENITCHIYKEILIEPNKLTLIKGPSGIGKSSIFQALTWCLYGKVKGVCNFNASKYSVTLFYFDIKIIRKGKPKLLQLIKPEEPIYEDQVAQSMIDNIFGPEDIWNVSCYLEQDIRSILLTGSNTERMDILNKLSFRSDNPEFYINKIDQEIKIQQQSFLVEQANYNAELKLFNDQLNKRSINPIYNITKDQLLEIEKSISKLNDEQLLMNTQLLEQNKLQGAIDLITSQVEVYSKKLGNYLNSDEYELKIKNLESQELLLNSKIDQLMNTQQTNKLLKDSYMLKTNELKGQLQNKEQLKYNLNMSIELLKKLKDTFNRLSKEISIKKEGLPSIDITKYHQISQIDLYKVSEQEKLRNNYIDICNKLNVEYSENKIKQMIDALRQKVNDLISLKSDITIKDNINKYKNKIEGLGSIIEYSDEEIIEAERDYTNKLNSISLMKCPHCQKTIRYINGTLHPENIPIISQEELSLIKKKIDEMKINKSKLNQKTDYLYHIKELEKGLKLTNFPIDLSEVNNLDNYNHILGILQQIKIIEVPDISSSQLEYIIEYNKLVKEYSTIDQSQFDIVQKNIDDIQNKLNELPSNLEEEINNHERVLRSIDTDTQLISLNKLKEELSKLHFEKMEYGSRVNDTIIIQKEIVRLTQERVELISKVKPEVPEKIKEISNNLEELKKWKDEAGYVHEILDKKRVLEDKANDINVRNSKLADLYSLKQKTLDLECTYLQSTVDSINESINEVLQDIFDRPIRVIISLYKKNKTNEKVKPSVNLSMIYDGNEYDNFSQLSGGEKDRISFALTLAISRINGSPLLLLDEVLRSLNEEYRTLCIEVLRNFFGYSKTIITINHEDVEGNYDNVITM